MSDPGHGSTAAGPSRLPVNFNSQSVGHLRSVPVRQGTRSTWAYSDYPPLDVVLESQKQDGPVAFPTTSSYAGSVMSLSPRQTPPISTLGQDFSRYPAGLFDSLSRPRGESTYSQASTTSRVTFSTLGRPHAGRASNKLRKTPGARRKSSLSISTTLASVMSDDVPPASPTALDSSQPLPHPSSPCLLTPGSSGSSSPKRRSPSPRSRQRKKSLFSRVFNFHRNRTSSAVSRRNEKGYTVEPLRLPQAEQRISFPERPGSTEGDCEGTTLAGSGDWRECWWNEKSQSEDGHAYGRGRRTLFIPHSVHTNSCLTDLLLAFFSLFSNPDRVFGTCRKHHIAGYALVCDGIWCLNNCLGIIALIDAAGGCTYLDMSWHKIQTWPCLDIVFDIIFDSSVGQCAYSASIVFCLGPPLPQHDGDQGGQRRHQRAHCKPAARFWARRRSIPSSPWQPV